MATTNDGHQPQPATATATATGVAGDIEVISSSVADSCQELNLEIKCKRLPKQLLSILAELRNLSLTVLHLNVSTVDQTVFYSFSLKVEDDCRVSTVDEIARAVYQLLCRIQREAEFSQF